VSLGLWAAAIAGAPGCKWLISAATSPDGASCVPVLLCCPVSLCRQQASTPHGILQFLWDFEIAFSTFAARERRANFSSPTLFNFDSFT